MRTVRLLAILLVPAAAALARPIAAQDVRVYTRTPDAPDRLMRLGRADGPRAVLGLSTTTSGSRRDTLGLLVASVAPGGPAERAGIEEGSRLQSINGVSLRVGAADAEDWEAVGLLSRRLTRELAKVKPGDEVELRVLAAGQSRTVRVRTADADSLYARRGAPSADERRRVADQRPTLGVQLGSTGSRRDTLGVLVLGVVDDGPAAKAGIEEGNRIAAIDGVSLRVSREDLEDQVVASSRVRRLTRAVAAKKAGDEVELRVYVGNGQFRTVRARLARAADLPRDRRSFIFGDGMVAPMPPLPPGLEIELGPMLRSRLERLRDRGPELRMNLERGLRDMELRLDDLGETLGRALQDVDVRVRVTRSSE